MTINTFVAGTPASIRESAEAARQDAEQAEQYASAWHHTRSGAEPVWHGQASENYQQYATRQGRSGDDAERALKGYARALDDLADSLDAVKARMAQAEETASTAGLTVGHYAIQPPQPVTQPPPQVPSARMSAQQAADRAQAENTYQAAQAEFGRQQQAYAEAQAIVQEARQMERQAHERQTAADNAATDGMAATPQYGEWEQMAATASASPAAVALSKAATDLETRSSNATRAQFETAAAGGPFAVRGMWGSMTAAQRAEMTSHFPQLVGSANGVPVVDRDQANRSLLGQQRAALASELRSAEGILGKAKLDPRVPNTVQRERVKKLKASLGQLDSLEQELAHEDKFLLGLNSTANGRGQVIVASGNPDKADNVVTSVPGTGSDLHNMMEYVHHDDQVVQRAHELDPHQRTAAVMWGDYESPQSLADASEGLYADHARPDLSKFQDGLRATHDGPGVSHNTVLGHSYGTTTVGYTARDYGLDADDVVFLGSPGVGVDSPGQLGIAPSNVHAGTAGHDVIDWVTPSPNVLDDVLALQPGAGDPHWFGPDPSDPSFGADVLPTSPIGQHTEYWDHQESLDSMTRVVINQR